MSNQVTDSIPVSGGRDTKRIQAPDASTSIPPRLTRTKARELALADTGRAADGSGTTPDTQELPTKEQAIATHDENIIDMTTAEGKSFDLIFACPNDQPNTY